MLILDCIYTNIDQYYKTPELSPGLGISLHKVVQCEPKLIASNKRTFTQTYRTNSQSARSAFVDALKVWYGNSLFDLTEKYIVIAKYLIKYMIYVWRLHKEHTGCSLPCSH